MIYFFSFSIFDVMYIFFSISFFCLLFTFAFIEFHVFSSGLSYLGLFYSKVAAL